jgi:hypothetical protein
MRRICLGLAGVLGSVAAVAGGSQARSDTVQPPCDEVFRETLRAGAPMAGPGSDTDSWIRRAMTQFRFHRRDDAVATVTSIDARLRDEYGRERPNDKEAALLASLGALRECFVRSEPAPLATATFQVFGPSAPDVRTPAGPGVIMIVGDIIAGRTTSDGTVALRVPSGPIEVRAEIHGEAGAAGAARADLAPGASGTVTIVLGEGKHPAYPTELVLLEAAAGTVPLSSGSFTLQFRENGAAVSIVRVISVVRLDAELREEDFLTGRFRAADGRIVARNAPGLLRVLPKNSWIFFGVIGRDAAGVHRTNVVRLRVTAPPA